VLRDLNFKLFIPLFLFSVTFLFSFKQTETAENKTASISKDDSLILPGEIHFENLKQLTFGGQNAECYFSPDGTKFSFQSTNGDLNCDQIFTMDLEGNNKKLVSTGKGTNTCAYYLPGNTKVIFSSTHEASDDCPPKPDFSKGYVWAIYDTYDIYSANEDGTDLKKLTNEKGYQFHICDFYPLGSFLNGLRVCLSKYGQHCESSRLYNLPRGHCSKRGRRPHASGFPAPHRV